MEDDGAAPRGARLTKRASRPSPAYGSPSTDSASSVPGGMPKKMDLRVVVNALHDSLTDLDLPPSKLPSVAAKRIPTPRACAAPPPPAQLVAAQPVAAAQPPSSSNTILRADKARTATDFDDLQDRVNARQEDGSTL